MDIGVFVLVVTISLGIGGLASFFGIGGGFLLLPTMILMLGMTTHEAVATSTPIMLLMALSSTIAYIKQKRVDYKITLIVASTSTIGSIFGAFASELVTGQLIVMLFGIVEIILAIILGLKKSPQDTLVSSESRTLTTMKWYIIDREHVDSDGIKSRYKANIIAALPLSFLAGFLSSMLGIGGGTLYLQIYIFLCGMSIHMAIACSMVSIFISMIASFVTFSAMGGVNFLVALAFGIGMIAGAQVGSFANKRVNSRYLKPMAACMIIIIAIRMIILALFENPS